MPNAKDKINNPPVNATQPTVKKGDLVRIAGARYYSGGTISTWVKSQLWRIKDVCGAEVILEREDAAPIFGSVNIVDLQVIESPKADDKDK